MGQLDFQDLQQTQRELIAANAYFDGIEVLVDDGTQYDAHEAGLRQKGVSILVRPVEEGAGGSQASHQLSLEVLNVVTLSVNPKRNADEGGANLSVLESIEQIVLSVLGYQRRPGEQFWMTPERVFQLVTFNPGLWEYEISFVRNFLFAPKPK